MDNYRDEIISVLHQLPVIPTLMKNHCVSVYGGILREIIYSVVNNYGKCKMSDIHHYLINGGDIDCSIEGKKSKHADMEGLFKYLLENNCKIEYVGYLYDGLGDKYNPDQCLNFDRNVYYGSYYIWIPVGEDYYKIDLVYGNTSMFGYTRDFSVNVLVCKYNYFEQKFIVCNLYEHVIDDIVNKRLIFLCYPLKVIYRAKKRLKSGYSIDNIKETVYKSKQAYIDSCKKYKYDYFRVCLEDTSRPSVPDSTGIVKTRYNVTKMTISDLVEDPDIEYVLDRLF